MYGHHLCMCCCCCCCFSHSAHWLPTRKKLLYTVANPARGLLNRGKKKKEKVWQRPPPLHAARSEKIKIKITRRIHMSRRYASRRYAGLGPSRVRTRIPTTRRLDQWVSLRKILRSVCYNNFPSLVASLFSWRCLAASSSSFLHAAMNLRPPSVTASTQTSAFNAMYIYVWS